MFTWRACDSCQLNADKRNAWKKLPCTKLYICGGRMVAFSKFPYSPWMGPIEPMENKCNSTIIIWGVIKIDIAPKLNWLYGWLAFYAYFSLSPPSSHPLPPLCLPIFAWSTLPFSKLCRRNPHRRCQLHRKFIEAFRYNDTNKKTGENLHLECIDVIMSQPQMRDKSERATIGKIGNPWMILRFADVWFIWFSWAGAQATHTTAECNVSCVH